ncbi:Cobalt/magnesium transport protein CorA [Burkholderiales bacterium]|nr:Cobalt/magnesium transport protein CorA [Burkholderiales bacterium]
MQTGVDKPARFAIMPRMLVNCVAYQNGRKLADIPVEDISEYVSRPDCFVWVALAEPTDAELDLMAEEFGLHELAVEDARRPHQRPKLDEYGDDLFAVLRTVERDAPDEDMAEGQVAVFVGRNYVLSGRHNTRRGFADVRERTEREQDLLRHGSGYVLYALMDAVVDRYFPVLDALEDELERLEESMFRTTPTRASIEAFYALKHDLMVLKHAVAPLMEVAGKLYGGRVPALCTGLGEYFRDVYDHLHRVNSAIEQMREMLQTAISVSLTLINLSESETTKRLAAWGALITIPTLIAGIYGMNFAHMPELGWTYGYPLILGLMAAVDGYLIYRFRKAGWL